jgi:hypothetical protein
MKRILLIAIGLVCFSGIAAAQPRPVSADAGQAASAPDIYQARYEGGIFGSSSKEKGTLKFDDANLRVVFYRTDGREMFSLPYESLLVIYPDSKESVPQSGKVISALPLPGAGLANLMSKSTKYANLTFDDPDVDVKGTASFRFDNKEALLAFINKLGTKAKMTQRGDAFYRPRGRAIF